MNKISVFLLYILLSIQTISIVDLGPFSLKSFHIAIAITFLAAIKKLSISKRLIPIFSYILFMIFWGAIGYLWTPPHSLYANYIFCLLLCISVSSLFTDTNYDEAVSSLKAAATLIIIFTIINLHLNISSIRLAQALEANTGARASINFLLYGGGANLEATWIALAAAFFIREKLFFLTYIATSFYIDHLLLSRAGTIASTLIFLYWIYLNIKTLTTSHKIKIGLFALSLSGFFLFVFQKKILHLRIFQRFSEIGNEPGSQGRLDMWKYTSDSFSNSPLFGHGLGNAIKSIEVLGFTGNEGNIHNYLIQHLLETGFLGLIAWVAFSLYIIRIKNRPELKCFFIAFWLISLVQFRGAEPLLYFTLAILMIPAKGAPTTQRDTNNENVRSTNSVP